MVIETVSSNTILLTLILCLEDLMVRSALRFSCFMLRSSSLNQGQGGLVGTDLVTHVVNLPISLLFSVKCNYLAVENGRASSDAILECYLNLES